MAHEHDRAGDRDRKHERRPVTVGRQRQRDEEAYERHETEEQRHVAQERMPSGSLARGDAVAWIQLPIHPRNPLTPERQTYHSEGGDPSASRRVGRTSYSKDVTRLLSLVALTAGIGAPVAAGTVRAATAEPLRVLFVGNSLTEANDLPAVVASLAEASGRKLETGAVNSGGYSLEDHWASGDAPKEILSGKWDVVVLQQGPSALPESQAHLKLWAQRFAALARRGGARPGLLTVWPES